jgi:tetratricopeptide (TPR) repeat protein
MQSGFLTADNSRLSKLLALGFLLLLLNSSYLAAFGLPTVFYLANITVHFVLGWVLLMLFLRLLARTWPGLPAAMKLSALILLLSGGLGVAILAFGAAVPFLGARKPLHWAATAHVIAGVIGVLALAFALLRPKLRQSTGSPQFARAFGGVLAVALLFPVVAGYYQKYTRASRDYIVNPTNAPLSMEGEGAGPNSPFWPSSSNTNVNGIIPANFFMTSESCARCHKDIYDQWNSSAHHHSSFNNQWYRKSIEYMQDVVGTQPSKWCAGCHDHAVFFNGRFDNPIKNQINTPEAQNGLGCLSCHSIVHVGSSMGNGDFEIEYPPMHDLATSENKFLQWGHDFLTYANPEMHTKTFIKPFMRENTPEYCASCHKVHLDKPVNGYRWFRGFNDYDNWQASGVSGQGARAFYYPDKPKKCAECHMPLVDSNDPSAKNGKVKSHRFPAANTAMPFVNGDHEQLKVTQDFLRDKQISVDIFAMTPGAPKAEQAEVKEIRNRATSEEQHIASMFAVGEESASYGATQGFITKPVEVIGPLNQVANATVRRGDSMRVEVVVRTRKVGHFFPGGTVDGFDVWVELEAFDNNGKRIFWSGEVEDGGKGPVEKGAHFYRSLMLDERGNPINKRNAWAARTVAYVRMIPPGAADTIHYRLNIPADCGDQITLKARVNYRKFNWWLTQWSYAGVRDPQQTDLQLGPAFDNGRWLFNGPLAEVSGKLKEIPNLPITVMAEDTATLRVINATDKLPEMQAVLSPQVRERWNDYGIGLLLQGDLKSAENVFLKVTQMDPAYVDGFVNVARARIQEGEMEAAAEILQKALALNPRLAKTNFFYALTLKAAGKYDEAHKYLQVAVEQYPRDRVVQNTIGRVLFLQRRYQEAVDALHKVLSIDPEDLQAHYNLMLCYQGLGKADEAKREETLYRRFKADESSQAITGPYRQLHPEDNNERQQIHEHVSVALGKPAKQTSQNVAHTRKPANPTKRKLAAAVR